MLLRPVFTPHAGESNVLVRLPLTVRATAPRFLHYGDTARLQVSVQNHTPRPLHVRVVVRTNGAILSTANSVEQLQLHGSAVSETACQFALIPGSESEGGGRAALSFPILARNSGVARWQVAAFGAEADEKSEELTDAQSNEFPGLCVCQSKCVSDIVLVTDVCVIRCCAVCRVLVLVPCTTEAFATYGTVADDAHVLALPVTRPRTLRDAESGGADSKEQKEKGQPVLEQFGGLEVSVSSTAFNSLQDAVVYIGMCCSGAKLGVCVCVMIRLRSLRVVWCRRVSSLR